MNKLDIQYLGILENVLHHGTEKKDRTGTGTLSLFGRQIRHNMSDGFPLLTTKKMAIKSVMTELKWFLKGDTNIKYLVDNGCKIWNGDAYKNYLNIYNYNFKDDDTIEPLTMEEFMEDFGEDKEFRDQWGELGPIYGKQWRNWTEYYVEKFNGGNPIIVERTKDQIANLIEELKTNPDSRRLMVNAWNVGELDQMTLPPCHYGFQVYTRKLSESERFNWYANETGSYMHHDHIELEMNENNVPTRAISLMWNQRSVDTFLGLPFNIASYAILLCLIAQETNLIPDELIGNLGDVHLYNNHIEQAKTLLSRKDFKLPTMKFDNVNLIEGEFDFELIDYKYNPSIKAPLSN